MVRISLPEAQVAGVKVFNLKGETVAVLMDGKSGPGHISFTKGMGNLKNGLYIVRLSAGDKSISKKLLF
jgi:hypothetical protein